MHAVVAHGTALLDTRPATSVATPDIWWDAIASIEPLGEQETYDLEVPTFHNFVAGDIVVHNSALMANFAENAALDAGKAGRAVLARDVGVGARPALHRLAGVR